jgi:hypothetical protein
MINKRIIAGLLTYVPGIRNRLLSKKTGGSNSARYCYSVWLRHLIMVNENGYQGIPKTVAELGPGDSIGIGLAALLSGAKKYVGLDMISYSSLAGNMEIFDELIELFKSRADIPDEKEFPRVSPRLNNYKFPKHILSDEVLSKSLDKSNIDKIRENLRSFPKSEMIQYFAPWNSADIVKKNTMDLIISQAVLEHIDNLDETYSMMNMWLKDEGIMSHQIDFSSHGTSDSWNGHWLYSPLIWSIIMRTRPYIVNRKPYSIHANLLKLKGFDLKHSQPKKDKSSIDSKKIIKNLKYFTEDDITIRGSYMLSNKL